MEEKTRYSDEELQEFKEIIDEKLRATPVAIMVGSGMGAKNGILFKTAVSLEETGKVEVVALDKTGTITSGEPEITDIIPLDNNSEEDLLMLAYSLEAKSEHPLAKAINQKAKEK